MIINGVELEDLDIFEADVAEKYEKELQIVETKIKNVNYDSNSKIIRAACIIIFDFFNSLFGEGTDKRIFGNKTNIMTCLKSLEELVKYNNDRKKELDEFTNKYSPNRAQRRAKK